MKLRIGKPVTPPMKVCSAHFISEDFFWSSIDPKVWTPNRRRLKKTAVPSQNLPTRTHDKKKKDLSRIQEAAARDARASARHCHEPTSQGTCREPARAVHGLPCEENPDDDLYDVRQHGQETASQPCPSGATGTAASSLDQEAAEALVQLSQFIQNVPDMCTQDKSIQVDVDSFMGKKFRLVDLLTSDNIVLAFTGVSMNLLIAVSNEVGRIEEAITEMSTLERVILVLVRLKTCLPFVCLAPLFCVSRTTVSRHFYSTLHNLAAVLESAIPWPDKQEIARNLPQCFEEYRDVRVVLDCTEVTVEKSHCASCRILTYSHYKGTHTAKLLVGVSPAGLITFVSRGFGGRASDRACVEKSAVLAKLNSFEDDVMVDKGFNIDVLCENLGLGVVQPPFLRGQLQFTAKDSEKTLKIARARVHVERAIQRMKLFKVLREPVPWEMVGALDDIFIVIGGIVNLSTPILSEKRF